jgi:hypothetical protein
MAQDDQTPAGTLKEGEVAIPKTELDTLTELRTRYTPPAEGKYELKVPEKTVLTPDHVQRTTALAAKLGLSNELAGEIVPFLDNELSAAQEALLAANRPEGTAYKARVEAWQKAALEDPELGAGDTAKLTSKVELGKKVVSKFFGEDMQAFLDESGFGNHPGVIKGFAKLGSMMSEKDLVTGDGKPPERKSTEEVFFSGSDSVGKKPS